MNTTLEHKSQTANQRAQQHESQSAKAYPSRTIVHAKLEMTEPGDHDEQEADAVATAIMSGGKISRKISSGASGSSGIAVSQQMESQLAHLQGSGRQMPEGLRNMMESGFGQDFSQVRLHTDSEAASMSSSIHAKAFTHGNDIYFNRGQFAPETTEGQHLVAHELTHVVQGTGKVGRKPHSMSHYVKEDPSWILGSGSAAYTKLRNNYIISEQQTRLPLTIVLYTTKKASDGAFDYNSPMVDFVNNEYRTKVLMIQGMNSLNQYIRKIKNLVKYHGPLQNLIIAGHGWYNQVDLGNNVIIDTSDNSDLFFATIKQLFEEADEELGPLMPHSILLPVCLTGANTDSPEGLVNHIQVKMGSNIHVRGNKAATYMKDHRFYYSDEEEEDSYSYGYLTFKNVSDKTSPVSGQNMTSKKEPTDKSYLGKETYGMLYEIKLHLEKQLNEIDSREFKSFPLHKYSLSGDKFEIDYIFDSTHKKKEFYGNAILDIIKKKITTNPPRSVENFINCLLFDYIPVNNDNPSLEDLFNGSQNPSDKQIEKWKIFYKQPKK